MIATPEFEAFFAAYQREYFAAVDKRLNHLLGRAVNALMEQLKDPDWRPRDAAIEQVFKLHGRLTEKLDVSGTLSHRGQIAHAHHLGRLGQEGQRLSA